MSNLQYNRLKKFCKMVLESLKIFKEIFRSENGKYSSLAPFAKPSDEGFTATSWLSAASNASVRRIAHLSRPKDTMLIDWCSRPTFLQADFHARQKKAHKNVRVNCDV